MTLYFALYLLIFLFSLLRKGSFSHYLIYIPLLVVLALKGQVGCDWYGYLNHYVGYDPTETIFTLRGEIGWYSIETLINYMGWDYQWYYVFSGIIGISFLLLAQRHIGSLGFLILIYPIVFIQLGLSGIRQFIAVCIGAYILSRYFFHPPKSIWPYILYTLLAATFHVSAFLLFFILPFLVELKPGLVFVLICMSLIAFTSSFADEVYQTFEYRYVTDRTRVSNGAWIRFFLTSIIISLGIFFSENKYIKLGLAILALGVIIGLFNSIALHRMNYFFVLIAALIILKNARHSPKVKIGLRAAYILSFLYMAFWFSFSTHSHCIVPYSFFFTIF